jgi:hypothetical protein
VRRGNREGGEREEEKRRERGKGGRGKRKRRRDEEEKGRGEEGRGRGEGRRRGNRRGGGSYLCLKEGLEGLGAVTSQEEFTEFVGLLVQLSLLEGIH